MADAGQTLMYPGQGTLQYEAGLPLLARLLPRSLGARILLASIAVQVLFFGLLLANNASLVERALAEQFTNRVEDLKPLLNASLAPLLQARQYEELAERLRYTRSDEDVEYLVLRDGNDVLVASAGWESTQVLPLASRQVIDKNGIFHTFMLVEAEGRKYGTLNLGFSTAKLAAYRNDLQSQGILIIAMGMLVIGVLNAWLAYRLTRRLRRLTEASEEVALGHFDLRLDESGSDEIARLAASMNAMSLALCEKISTLQESEERMRLAMDAGRVVPWERDLRDDVLRWGAGVEQLLGPPPSVEHGYPDLLSMVAEEDRERLLLARSRALREKTMYRCDLQVRRSDGTLVWLAVRGKYVRNSAAQTGRLIGVARDITAGKKAEFEIRRLNQELEQRVQERTVELEAAMKELEAFSYTVSHDLRAPLRAVDGLAKLMAQECAASPMCGDKRFYLGRIETSVRKMSLMIDDLLCFSKASRMPLACAMVVPGELVAELLEDIRFAEAARATINVFAMPSCWGDPALLRQIYINLISNALKYSSKSDAPIVDIGASPVEQGEVVYYVRDNGVGFDPRSADRLFGVFQRLHSSSDFEGTGVGLAIVQRIVLRHGGRVWAKSAPGQGATFYFTLAAQS